VFFSEHSVVSVTHRTLQKNMDKTVTDVSLLSHKARV